MYTDHENIEFEPVKTEVAGRKNIKISTIYVYINVSDIYDMFIIYEIIVLQEQRNWLPGKLMRVTVINGLDCSWLV